MSLFAFAALLVPFASYTFLVLMISPVFIYASAAVVYVALAASTGGVQYDDDDHEETDTRRYCPSGPRGPSAHRPYRTLDPAEAQECPICLSHASNPVALACGHAFHSSCVERWLSLSAHATCPICRALT